MSLTIDQAKNGEKAVLSLTGRLDTATAPELESKLREILPDVRRLELNFEKLDYISSAGLRVLLVAQKEMNKKQGALTLTNVNEMIQEVLDVTGFSDILTIA